MNDDAANYELMPRSESFATITSFNDIGAFFGDLLFFVDETGDETLRDPANPLFGFGACAIPYDDYKRVIADPWAAMKDANFGGAMAPFHATDDLRQARGGLPRRQAVMNYFKSQAFWRVGAILTPTTVINDATASTDEHAGATDGFIMMMKDICGRVGHFNRLILVFEDSARGNPKLEQRMKGMRLGRRWFERGLVFENNAPVLRFFLPKSAREAGLEVADVIAHAATALTRKLSGKSPGRGLHDAVFQTYPALTKFAKLDELLFSVDTTNIGSGRRTY